MSTFKIQKINVSSNVVRAKSEIKLAITNTSTTGNILEGEASLPYYPACEEGLVFTCEDNSQYLSLI